MKLKSTTAAIFTALALTLAVPQQAAATGLVAGATEFTQIFNNIELLAQTGVMSSQMATQIQQFINQIYQLDTMRKNLLQMPTSIIQARFGNEWQNVAPFVAAYKSATNLQTAANQVAQDQRIDFNAMRTLGMTPRDYYGKVSAAARAGNTNAKDHEAQSLQHMQILQTRAAEVEKLNQQIPEIDGNVKGFQHLALMAGRTQQLMLDQQMQYEKISQYSAQDRALAAVDRENEAAAKINAADAADAYAAARRAEQDGISTAFSYPKKP